ncbi:MAG: D-amino-acid transaminase [Hyphomicrobiales bacterium]|nr:D-amino-acid transaminase [Hyphomicrobiales bacterium]
MSRIAYVNGQYVRHDGAAVHIEDRGYQFADGVYEVIAVHGGRLVDEEGHLDRLAFSLSELEIDWPVAPAALRVILRQVIRRNGVANGIVYIQVTRGVAPRDHAFPADTDSALVVTARRKKPLDRATAERGVSVITIPDIRWKRRDIKSISLLPNVLGKQQAVRAGAFEAWMYDAEDRISEGTSSNAWIVTAGGELVTRQADHAILNGITRRAVLRIAAEQGLTLVERPFTRDEVRQAREAFVTSTTSFVRPVIRMDGAAIGDGRAGELSLRLLDYYFDHMRAQDAAP